MRTSFVTKAAAVSTLLTIGGFAAFASGANALVRNVDLVNAPYYCEAVYGDPSPCPPPDRPESIDDPACLRVDILPRHCPWLP